MKEDRHPHNTAKRTLLAITLLLVASLSSIPLAGCGGAELDQQSQTPDKKEVTTSTPATHEPEQGDIPRSA